MTIDSRPVLLFDLDETVLGINSFPVWASCVAAARFPALPAARRVRTGVAAIAALGARKLGRIDHAELKQRLARLWRAAVANDVRGLAMRSLAERLTATVRPNLAALLREVREGRVDALLTTAAAADYAVPLGHRLGFSHVVASEDGSENLGERKRDNTLARLHELGWQRRVRVLFTDHLDDLPLVRAAERSVWFGGLDSLAAARALAEGSRIEWGLPASEQSLREWTLGSVGMEAAR